MQDRSCYKLTQEGERLFRMQKYEQGIDLLKKALEVGTDDFSLLSAIYCQLGNAHTMLKDYEQALKFHTYDILVERLLGNKEGEAKSCANLGNIFKMKGAYNDALTFTFKQLDFAEELGDKVLKSRAYYNIATIYVERGRCTKLEAAEEKNEAKNVEATSDFENAAKYFKLNLEVAEQLEDALTMGRCYGSLGNTFYCLGDYDQSIHFHKLRLELSQQYGDRASMRRAHANIANCHALKSNMPLAIQHYKLAYNLAMEIGNKTEEAQMAYSLANALYIGKEVQKAITYFQRHLKIARSLEDISGQLRSYYSLALSFNNLCERRKALYFLVLAKRSSLQVNDTSAITDIDNLLNEILEAGQEDVLIDDIELIIDQSADPAPADIEHRELRLTYFQKRNINDRPVNTPEDPLAEDRYEKEEFFDMLAKLQSKRMNDQRVDASVLNTNIDFRVRQTDTEPDNSSTDGSEVLIDLILNAQERRMDDQRAPFLPGLNPNGQIILRRLNTDPGNEELDDHLVEWLMRVQSQRLDEQRSELPPIKPEGQEELDKKKEEDVTAIVMRMQAGRLEDQRAHLPNIPTTKN
ncbi:CRE-AGS-3 protein [Caenorhabditis remanei]|uniref:CRE-AGS-3 protein n=1 Tax=Caenorhabditis remanei TaxID=31234 RepID=E3LE30_CAERE|nr:CRE-AGS-3 protein [Caenorhabditis remanei]